MLIFHSPMPVEREPQSGSSVRPQKMLEAFQSITEVYVVDGPSKKRAEDWAKIRKWPISEITGVYSELSTMPMALTDPDHIPRRPFLDYSAFRGLSARGVPVSAFYRDVYWRYPSYGANLNPLKRAMALAAYNLEYRQLAKSLSHVYMPSLQMLDHLPAFRHLKHTSLPPGGDLRNIVRGGSSASTPLRFLYVGGVTSHYDIRPMVRAVQAAGVELTICCRAAEWEETKRTIPDLSNIKIVHGFGTDLEPHYRIADAFLMWWPAHPYMRFAMPVKFGEAAGWGLPIIANSETEVGQLVAKDSLGFAVPDEVGLADIVRKISRDRTLIDKAAAKAARARARHSWKARAEQVLSDLAQCRQHSPAE